MRTAVILLLVVLAIVAFVDASAIERRRIGDLREVCPPLSNDQWLTVMQRGMKPRCTDGSSHEGHVADSNKANKNSKTSTATHTIKAAKGTTKGTDNKKAANTNKKSTTKAKGNGKKGANTSTATASATLASSNKGNTGNNSNDNNDGNDGGATGSEDAATTTCLVANALQTGSEQNGQNGTVEAGQVASQTYPPPSHQSNGSSDNNFINICSGQTLTNGLQITTGSCNGIPLVHLPIPLGKVSALTDSRVSSPPRPTCPRL
jgi:hypothetical protein